MSVKLALYQYPSCPYCRMVTRILCELDVDVELRDVLRERQFMQELLEARRRRTVPVLRITTEHDDFWMPESSDIIRYLKENFSK